MLQSETLHRIRNRLANQLLFLLLLVSPLPLIISVSRTLSTGWHPVMLLHVTLFAVACVMFWNRRSIPLEGKSFFLVVMMVLIGVGGVVKNFQSSSGGDAFLLMALCMAAVFYRASIVITLLCGVFALLLWRALANDQDTLENLAIVSGNIMLSMMAIFGVGRFLELIREKTDELEVALAAAESSARAKTQFLANASHEIRTPMTAILGTLELLHSRSAPGQDRSYIERAQLASKSLLHLLNDILDFSRLEGRKFQLNPEPLKVSSLRDWIAGLYQVQVQDKGMKLKVEVDDLLQESWVHADGVRIQQVLGNLLNNALKFTHQGGIEVNIRCLTENPDSYRVQFLVTDTGDGIAAAEVNRLMEPFEQADNSHKRGQGTGLGLAICKELLTLMGASLKVDSRLGEGSTFSFTLLLNKTDPPPQEQTDFVCRAMSCPMKVLVAEDTQFNQLVIEEMVRDRLPLDLTFVENGKMAVDAINNATYDLVLMDLQMPEMDGLEATREIRRNWTKEALPIIALTASALENGESELIDAGMNDCIHKPINSDRLDALLKRYLCLKTCNVRKF